LVAPVAVQGQVPDELAVDEDGGVVAAAEHGGDAVSVAATDADVCGVDFDAAGGADGRDGHVQRARERRAVGAADRGDGPGLGRCEPVQRLVPSCRIAVGHGKMNEKEMERVMLDFIDYKYDVLVATTIIENGIDIPRANTIIINRADNYGLSQLYQLRGRVGRSNRRAYAYLLIPAEQELSPIARRRLAAIREFSELGAGFRIAALDLELRGAGNLLGGQQSGHMDALGFDLYTQMLERTVSELRGEQVEDETSVTINLAVDVAIPETYVSDMGQRLRTYKRVSSARDEEALTAIRAETEDRYGRIPESVENLFAYARLRQAAEDVGVISIDRAPGGIAVKLSEKARVAPEKLMEMVRVRTGASFTPNGVLRLELSEEERDEVLAVARRMLLQIRSDG